MVKVISSPITLQSRVFFLEGYRTLKAGQQVNYEVQAGPKGYHASEIVLADGDEAK